jgi:hypothetical protein
MKRALILGCSHAAGSEMTQEADLDLQGYEEKYYGYYMSYPAQLARLMGYETTLNHAIPGGSNDAMFRIFETYTNPYKHLPKPDIVIACWTGPERTEIWNFDEGSWVGLAGGKTLFSKTVHDDIAREGMLTGEPLDNRDSLLGYQKQWVTHHADRWWGRLNKLKNMLALNTMAEQHNIPVINIDSFGGVTEYNFPDTVYRPIENIEFCNWAADYGFNNTKFGHYFTQTHKTFANFIFKKLDPKYHANFAPVV